MDRGYVRSNQSVTGTADRTGSQHLLAAADGSDVQTVVNRATRLEFQDGKRGGVQAEVSWAWHHSQPLIGFLEGGVSVA